MLNALQIECGANGADASEATRPLVDAADVAGKTGADHEACNADLMFDAVCARLARLVEHGVAAQTRAGVLECVAALGQLHEHDVEERARHYRCEQELIAARSALALARVDTAVHLATVHPYRAPWLPAACAANPLDAHAGAFGEQQLRRR